MDLDEYVKLTYHLFLKNVNADKYFKLNAYIDYEREQNNISKIEKSLKFMEGRNRFNQLMRYSLLYLYSAKMYIDNEKELFDFGMTNSSFGLSRCMLCVNVNLNNGEEEISCRKEKKLFFDAERTVTSILCPSFNPDKLNSKHEKERLEEKVKNAKALHTKFSIILEQKLIENNCYEFVFIEEIFLNYVKKNPKLRGTRLGKKVVLELIRI